MVVRNFKQTSAVEVERTEMGAKITLGSHRVLENKTEQVSGWFELDAVEQLIAELQQLVTDARTGE